MAGIVQKLLSSKLALAGLVLLVVVVVGVVAMGLSSGSDETPAAPAPAPAPDNGPAVTINATPISPVHARPPIGVAGIGSRSPFRNGASNRMPANGMRGGRGLGLGGGRGGLIDGRALIRRPQ